MCPAEMTATIMYTLLLTRDIFVVAGKDGKIGSFIINGNIKYSSEDAYKFSSILNNGSGINNSDITASINYSKEETSGIITNKIIFGSIDGKLESYNFENTSWNFASSNIDISNNGTLFDTPYKIVSLFIYDNALIIVTNKGVASYSFTNKDFIYGDGTIHNSDGSSKTRVLTTNDVYCKTSQMLSTADITVAILFKTSLILGDASGNVASYSFTTGGWTKIDGANFNTLVGPGYYTNWGITLKQTQISSFSITSFVDPTDLSKVCNFLFVGYIDGSIITYSFEDNVWFFQNDITYPTNATYKIKGLAVSGSVINNEAIVKVLSVQSEVYVFSANYMISANMYTGGWTDYNKNKINEYQGPGDWINMKQNSGYGTITSAIITTLTNNAVAIFAGLSSGSVLIYYIKSKTYDFDIYCKLIIGNRPINTIQMITVPFSPKVFNYENPLVRDEYYMFKDNSLAVKT
jgi:hypothetical protein